jgi:two-component sensor histidine kinase/sensor domain CHASE-containing protein
MSIRLRTLLLIAGTTVGLLVLLYTISAFLFMASFARLERREALRGLEQARNALAGELDELAVFNHDWASWDDTYAFVQDRNSSYLQANLVDQTFTGARLNLMMFLDRAGATVYAKAFDWRRNAPLPVPGELLRNPPKIRPEAPPAEEGQGLSGILLLPRHPMLISAQPVLTSLSRGPRRGTLIMGRYLDGEELAALAEQTRLELRLVRLDREALEELPGDSRAALALHGELVRPLDEQRIAAYALLPDLFGEAALVLRAVIPRVIHQQGVTVIRYLVLSLLATGLVFCLVVMVLLESALLRRLSRLSREVSGIGQRRDLAERVAEAGSDELGALGASINGMLAELQKTVETHRALTRAVPDLILRVADSGAILEASRPEDPLLEPVGPEVEASGSPQRPARRLPASFAERSRPEIRQAMVSGRMRVFEHRLELAGEVRDYETRILALAPGEALEIIRDVTERKRVEELAKKELLLREIHHRVKNNLQVISSLLYLQSQQVGDPRLSGILEEDRQRIRSIALIHEKLYQSEEPGEVRIAAYLRDLTNHLVIAYGAGAPRVRLEISVREEEELDLDTVILLGLLISELVSNSLKYAFPRGSGGLIRIALERTGPEGLRLEVGDDGIGLPADCDPAASGSMGLLLVRLLAKQLEATMEVRREGGTLYVFLFRGRR